MVNSIVIENDGAFEEVEYTPCEDVTALSKEEIVKKVKRGRRCRHGRSRIPDTCEALSEGAGKRLNM